MSSLASDRILQLVGVRGRCKRRGCTILIDEQGQVDVFGVGDLIVHRECDFRCNCKNITRGMLGLLVYILY